MATCSATSWMPWRIAWMPLVRTGCGLRADRRRCYACTESCGDSLPCTFFGGPGRIRTCGTRFRKPLLYPLSYGALAERLTEPLGNTRHSRLVTTGEAHGAHTGLPCRVHVRLRQRRRRTEGEEAWTRRWWTSPRGDASRSGSTTASSGWRAITSTAPR